jgi:hypothetical protein
MAADTNNNLTQDLQKFQKRMRAKHFIGAYF